jgi:hypothetical protein
VLVGTNVVVVLVVDVVDVVLLVVVVVVLIGIAVVVVVVVEVGTYGTYVALISNQDVPESAVDGACANNNKLLGTTLPYASSLIKALNEFDATLLPIA